MFMVLSVEDLIGLLQTVENKKLPVVVDGDHDESYAGAVSIQEGKVYIVRQFNVGHPYFHPILTKTPE